MQLPPDEEVVMVSGHPPIKAAKLRYYQDRNFMGRMLAPPVLALVGYADKPTARSDDWSGLAIPAMSEALTENSSGGFADEGGHQLKPELDLALDAQPLMDIDDLLVLDDEDDMPLQPQSLKRDRRDIGDPDQRMQRNARLAALDPDDGIAL
jgi:type IV secretion system protein VirD4